MVIPPSLHHKPTRPHTAPSVPVTVYGFASPRHVESCLYSWPGLFAQHIRLGLISVSVYFTLLAERDPRVDVPQSPVGGPLGCVIKEAAVDVCVCVPTSVRLPFA